MKIKRILVIGSAFIPKHPWGRILLLVSMAVISTSALLRATQATIGSRPTTVVTLRTFKGGLDTGGPISALITSTIEAETVYVVNGFTGEVRAYKDGPSPSYRPFTHTEGPLAIRSSEYIAFVDRDSKVVLAETNERILSKINTPPVFSLAILNNGNIVVASPTENHFLHLYKPTGQPLRSFGTINKRKATDLAETQFLHRGKIVVDAADNIYYVYNYLPLIQKFSPTGEFEHEIKVEGDAIELQQELAQRFLSARAPNVVGGITIINSATIDRKTGHLWVGLNGSSITANVYEYDAKGEKLHEYALEVSSPFTMPEVIPGVKDIAITSSSLYVLTNLGEVFDFQRSASSALPTSNQQERRIQKEVYSIIPVTWSPAARKPVLPRPPCGTDQEWLQCPFTCPGPACNGTTPTTTSSDGASLDCKVELASTLNPGYTVVTPNCNTYAAGTPMHMRGGCFASVRICVSGVNSDHTLIHDCQAPNCSGSSGGGGGGGDCAILEGCGGAVDFTHNSYNGCPASCYSDYVCCYPTSPILIDVSGNGFNLTGIDNPVSFDITATERPVTMSWTAQGSDDAFLAMDRNGNGSIDNGSELFGNFTPQPASRYKNGFIALAEYDKPANGGNSDGVIDQRDAIFSGLLLWQDLNHNAISEPNEIHTLPALNIVAIHFDYKESKRTDEQGNHFRYRAKVDDAQHSHVGRWAWDVYFVTASQ